MTKEELRKLWDAKEAAQAAYQAAYQATRRIPYTKEHPKLSAEERFEAELAEATLLQESAAASVAFEEARSKFMSGK